MSTSARTAFMAKYGKISLEWRPTTNSRGAPTVEITRDWRQMNNLPDGMFADGTPYWRVYYTNNRLQERVGLVSTHNGINIFASRCSRSVVTDEFLEQIVPDFELEDLMLTDIDLFAEATVGNNLKVNGDYLDLNMRVVGMTAADVLARYYPNPNEGDVATWSCRAFPGKGSFNDISAVFTDGEWQVKNRYVEMDLWSDGVGRYRGWRMPDTPVSRFRPVIEMQRTLAAETRANLRTLERLLGFIPDCYESNEHGPIEIDWQGRMPDNERLVKFTVHTVLHAVECGYLKPWAWYFWPKLLRGRTIKRAATTFIMPDGMNDICGQLYHEKFAPPQSMVLSGQWKWALREEGVYLAIQTEFAGQRRFVCMAGPFQSQQQVNEWMMNPVAADQNWHAN